MLGQCDSSLPISKALTESFLGILQVNNDLLSDYESLDY